MIRRFGWLLLLALAFAAVPARAQSPDSAARAVAWIRTQQDASGGFAGIGISSTADALYALAHAGLKTDDVAVGGKNAQAFIEANVAEIAAKPGIAAKYVIAELLTGHSPRNVAGTDLVAVVSKSSNAATGVYGPDVTSHSLAILALVAAGEPLNSKAVDALLAFQLDDGSWSFTGDRTPLGGDTNTTALAIQALVAAGQRLNPAVARGLAYLETQQNSDGGFPYSQASSYGTASDANSTALVIQAIVATSGNPTAAPWADAGGNALSALLALQNASGAFRYDAATADDNAFATYQAVPAVLYRSFPLESIAIIQPAPEPTPAPTTGPTAPVPGVPGQLPNTGAPAVPAWPIVVLLAAGLLLMGAQLRRRTH
jgi:hypothetical protein